MFRLHRSAMVCNGAYWSNIVLFVWSRKRLVLANDERV
jgi:hypothetical protein